MSEEIQWSLAACKDTSIDFFPTPPPGDGDRSAYDRTVFAAKLICSVCPIKAECLRYGMERSPNFGIWGGTTPEERRGARRVG